MFKCAKCGYIHWVDELPDRCPSCGGTSDAFARLSDDAAAAVEESLFENEVLVDTLSSLNNIIENISGILEEDPDVSAVFQSTYKNSVEMAQTIKAEIENRVKNGLWG